MKPAAATRVSLEGEDWATPRALALYAVSAHAAVHGLLAWDPPGGAAPLVAVLGLAAAQVAGATAGPVAFRLADAGSRRRLRLTLRAVYGCLACLGLAMALAAGTTQALALAVRGLIAAQAVVLVLAPVEPRPLLPLLGALALVALAALRGGPIGGLAVVGALALVPFPLAYEHFERRLRPGRRRGSLLATATRQAGGLAAPPVLVVAAAFLVWPPTTYAPVRPQVDLRSREQVEDAYQRSLLLGLFAGGLVLGLVRLSRHRRGERLELAEPLEPEAVVDEPLPPPPAEPEAGVPPGNRGRVVRAYLRVLAQAQRQGWRRGAGLTPGEIARRFWTFPELRRLTARFEAARYGPAELPDEEARAAEDEAAALTRRRLISVRDVRARVQGAEV